LSFPTTSTIYYTPCPTLLYSSQQNFSSFHSPEAADFHFSSFSSGINMIKVPSPPTPTQMWSVGVLFSEERVGSMGNAGNMMEGTGPNGTLNFWGSSVRFRPSEEYQAYFTQSISTFHLLILPVFCYFYKSLVLYISLVIPVWIPASIKILLFLVILFGIFTFSHTIFLVPKNLNRISMAHYLVKPHVGHTK